MNEVTAGSGNIVVGISVSEPSADDLVRLGLSELHVRHAFIEIVRHILARGWSIAHGGDLRVAGYTEALFDLVRTYDRRDLSGPDRIFSYLAWPVWLEMTMEQRAALANVATIKMTKRPEGAPETLRPYAERQADELLWNSLALTTMRIAMNSEIHARVVLGGRISGQQGLCPGVVEESVLALDSSVPLYVAGGFGGCGRVIASSLGGSRPIEMSVDYQLEHTSRYGDLLNEAISVGQAPDFTAMLDTFNAAGAGGLHNGLDSDDNRRLFTTDDVDVVVALVLRGLRRMSQPK